MKRFRVLWVKIPAFKRHLTHAFSFWKLLPWLALDLRKDLWLGHCRTHQNGSSLSPSFYPPLLTQQHPRVQSIIDLGCIRCWPDQVRNSDWGRIWSWILLKSAGPLDKTSWRWLQCRRPLVTDGRWRPQPEIQVCTLILREKTTKSGRSWRWLSCSLFWIYSLVHNPGLADQVLFWVHSMVL